MEQEAVPQVSPEMTLQSEHPVSAQSHGVRNIVFILLAVIVLLGVAGGSYYLGVVQTQQGDKMPVDHPLPAISRSPTVAVAPTHTPDPIATWKLFANTKYFYSLKYPQGLIPKETNVYYYYVTFTASNAAAPEFVVSAIPDTFTVKDPAAYNYMSADWIDNIGTMQIGENKALDATSTYTRIADVAVGGQQATAIQIHANGSMQERVYVKNNNAIYMISTYYQDEKSADLARFKLFLSTFRFTE